MADDSGQFLDSLLSRMRSAASPLRDKVTQLWNKYKDLDDGKVADYIPELAKANPDWFAISIVSINGQRIDVGNSDQEFTIQSVSKPLFSASPLKCLAGSMSCQRLAFSRSAKRLIPSPSTKHPIALSIP